MSDAEFIVLLISGLAGAFVVVHLVPLWVQAMLVRGDAAEVAEITDGSAEA